MAVCVLHEAPRTGMPRALLPLNDDELAGLRPATTSDHRPNHRWAWEPAPPASGPPPTTPPARRSPRRPPSRLVGTPSPHGSCRGVHGVPCSSGTPSTASAVRFWWAGRIYPAPTSTTTPHRQSRSICRGGTCAARRPGREPRRPSSRPLGAPFPYGSCRGVHAVTAFKRRAASRRSCSTLVGGPDISGPYEYHPPPSTIRSCLQGRHVWRTNRKGAQISVPLREASCW